VVEDSKFDNTILTNIGHQMLASISSGNRKITYTKAEAYAQDVSSISNETLQALTSLQGKVLSADLLVSNDSGNIVTITANFRNKGLTEDVIFNSIGWFAKLDTDDAERGIKANQEYLIGITPASGTQTLVAPPADQSSSQAISINLNMALSDAANVNMTVSDAGTVHFNQLDDQLAKYTTTAELTKLLAGKADLGLSYTKAEIDAKLLDLTADTDGKVSADQVQALIRDKANISDVYTKSQVDSALSTRDTEISTKANISDVYTKSQVDNALSARDAQISSKANISDVYTKSDVDSAFTDVRGRLGKLEGTQTLDSPDFNSITSTGVYYITNNTPANIKNNPVSQWGVLVVSSGEGQRISQVYYPDDGSPQWCRLLNGANWLPWYQLSTKKDVSNAIDLANKAQATANTKANASDVYTKTETDNQINKFDLSKVKFRKRYINSDGQTADKTWSATKNDDGTYTIDLYNDDWTASKLADVLAQLPNKADTSTVNAQIEDAKNTIKSNVDNLHNDLQNQVNTKLNKTDTVHVVTSYDVNNNIYGNLNEWPVTRAWYVDQIALVPFADQINQLKGRQKVDAPDFNTLTDTGVYFITNPDKGKNSPPTTKWGTLAVFNGNSQRIIQIFSADDGTDVFVRIYGINGTTSWGSWNQIAWKSDITRLQNQINQQNQTIQSLTSRLNNAENEINYIKANYIEGKQFPASQEAQAEAWENENPQRIAFIER
jgi:cell division protein FtsB